MDEEEAYNAALLIDRLFPHLQLPEDLIYGGDAFVVVQQFLMCIRWSRSRRTVQGCRAARHSTGVSAPTLQPRSYEYDMLVQN
ncbi:hypothetical protein BV20DRAFT_971425 [Pilatotrama ljubarskyi]|nr:hypothetical protein BV20DRAFT_971425 [Pilatotrama ljubarskyi]